MHASPPRNTHAWSVRPGMAPASSLWHRLASTALAPRVGQENAPPRLLAKRLSRAPALSPRLPVRPNRATLSIIDGSPAGRVFTAHPCAPLPGLLDAYSARHSILDERPMRAKLLPTAASTAPPRDPAARGAPVYSSGSCMCNDHHPDHSMGRQQGGQGGGGREAGARSGAQCAGVAAPRSPALPAHSFCVEFIFGHFFANFTAANPSLSNQVRSRRARVTCHSRAPLDLLKSL
jgi:hypothetical protein